MKIPIVEEGLRGVSERRAHILRLLLSLSVYLLHDARFVQTNVYVGLDLTARPALGCHVDRNTLHVDDFQIANVIGPRILLVENTRRRVSAGLLQMEESIILHCKAKVGSSGEVFRLHALIKNLIIHFILGEVLCLRILDYTKRLLTKKCLKLAAYGLGKGITF